jgi:hypothetical protein
MRCSPAWTAILAAALLAVPPALGGGSPSLWQPASRAVARQVTQLQRQFQRVAPTPVQHRMAGGLLARIDEKQRALDLTRPMGPAVPLTALPPRMAQVRDQTASALLQDFEHLSKLRPPPQVQSQASGSSSGDQGPWVFTAPFQTAQVFAETHTLCDAQPFSDPDGSLGAYASATSGGGYKRGNAVAYVQQQWTAPRAGWVQITVGLANFKARLDIEVTRSQFGKSANWFNESNTGTYYLLETSRGYDDEDVNVLEEIPPPNEEMRTFGGRLGVDVPIQVKRFTVNAGDVVTLRAGIRQYARARGIGSTHGIALGNTTAKVELIQFEYVSGPG